MLLSSGVVWRHRTLEDFRADCPGGDPGLQAVVLERLDEGLGWLESLGAPVVARETGNPQTVGLRFDTRGLTEALLGRVADVRLRTPLSSEAARPLLLASGGFGADLARRRGLLRRGNEWNEGDGLRYARRRGAALAGDLDEFYGRNLPAPPARVTEASYVGLAQLYGRFALVVDIEGRPFAPQPLSWSETDLVQATARRPRALAWYVVDSRALGERVRERTVAEMVDAAEAVGGDVRRGDTLAALGLPSPPDSPLVREPPFAAVLVRPGVTHTLGGIRVDGDARVLGDDGAAVPMLYAAGVDAGGLASGGYASGLAAALVLGRVAAETAAGEL